MSYKPSGDNSSPIENYLPCPYCGTHTPVAILGNYSRCRPCFDVYCAEVGTGRVSRGLDRAALARIGSGGEGGPRSWAYRLRDRHHRGERLTRAQVEAYRSVLHTEPSGLET